MFDTDLKNQLFPDVDFSDTDLLIFQGNATKMQKIVDEKLYLCPLSVLSTIYLEYFTSLDNLTKNKLIYFEPPSHKCARMNNETESLSNTSNIIALQTGLG